jgi:hypothetical protein
MKASFPHPSPLTTTTHAYTQETGVSSSECPLCLSAVEDPVATPCCHIMCRSCLKESVAYSSSGHAEVCNVVCTSMYVCLDG